jgi:outer membrane lipoprotein carrier protein
MRVARLLITICFAGITIGSFAQNEAGSKEILDKTASINNGYKTIQADFKLTITGVDKQVRNESGKILIKGDKYHLTLTTSDIIFDGKNIYTYLKERKEVNITKPEPAKVEKGDFFFSNPRDVFKGYTKNFKSAFSKETSNDNKSTYEIDLFPIDLKTKYSRLRMHIQKSTYQIQDIRLFQKDGTQFLLEFSNFSPNREIGDNEFVFDEKKYPGIEVNDMRF